MQNSRQIVRRSTPRVIEGRVQKKNNWLRDGGDYYRRLQPDLVIDRQRPGKGYRHLLTVRDIREFIALIPNWNELSQGLQAVVLAPARWGFNGYHIRGVVHICAWEQGMWTEHRRDWCESHAALFDRLGLEQEELPNGYVQCKWTEGQARAFQLLHILLHELGHHHDRITTRRQWGTARGEPYAEAFAYAYESHLWDAYWRRFGAP